MPEATEHPTPEMRPPHEQRICSTYAADAALIAKCAEFEAIEARLHAIYEAPNSTASDEETRAATAPVHDYLDATLDTLDEMQARTPAGIHARVRLMSSHNGDGAHSWNFPQTHAGRLLGAAMRDAMELPIGGTGVGQDCELIAAVGRFLATDAARNAASGHDDSVTDRWTETWFRDLAAVNAAPAAQTPAGLRAMAEAAFVAGRDEIAAFPDKDGWTEHATPESIAAMRVLAIVAGRILA